MKRLLPCFLLLLTLASCSKDPDEKPNQPPTAFQVTVSNASASSVQLAWTAATDPEGGAIAYSVVVGTDTVSRKQSGTTIALSTLAPNTSYAGSVIATDREGNYSKAAFSFSTTDSPTPSTFLLSQVNAGISFVEITWTPAAITDNSPITYDVYLDGTLVKTGLTAPGYRFEGLKEKTTYTAKVVAKSNGGKSSEKQMQITTRTATTAPVLTATAGFSAVQFSFTPSSSPDAHWLQYELVLNNNRQYTTFTLEPNKNLVMGDMVSNSTNALYIRVVNNLGDTVNSNTVNFTMQPRPNFGAVTLTEGSGTFSLSFDKGTTATQQSLALLLDGNVVNATPTAVTTDGTILTVTYPQSALPASVNNRIQVQLNWPMNQNSTTTAAVTYKYYNYTATSVTIDRAFLTITPYMQFNIIFTDHIISEHNDWDVIDVAFESFHYGNLLMPGLGAPNKTYITGNYSAGQLEALQKGSKGYVIIKDASGYHKHNFTYTFQ